ncbi:MAG: capsular biosynthesis protein [Clostridium butyricum]|nr:capsular biosynthesis protein [Clostridium butyricum]
MNDIHTHILPGLDDGSPNLKITFNMLNEAVNCGVSKIAATPHYYVGCYENEYKKVKSSVKILNKLIYNKGLNIKVYPGQEIYYSNNIITQYKSGHIGTINESRYMLIEFDLENFDDTIIRNLYELQILGIIPIIAHPERYSYIIDNTAFINKFIHEGYLFQLNSGSLEGKFGLDIKRTAKILLNNNIYNFIGSDAHNDGNRKLNMGKALKVIQKRNNMYLSILEDNNEKVFNNEKVVFIGKKIKKIKWLIF